MRTFMRVPTFYIGIHVGGLYFLEYFLFFWCFFLAILPQRKVEHGKCTYLNSDHIDSESREALIQKYTQFHAAHALIPTGTRVIVTRGNKTVTVVIDCRIPSKGLSSSSLELNDEAANALAIWEDGVVDCNLQIDTSLQNSNFVTYVVKPIAVVVVYLAAVVMSSYWWWRGDPRTRPSRTQ